MAGSNELIRANSGAKITGVFVVPSTGEGPTQAQLEKLKPTVYRCAEATRYHGVKGSPGHVTMR